MRISDWSSDVLFRSFDVAVLDLGQHQPDRAQPRLVAALHRRDLRSLDVIANHACPHALPFWKARSEEHTSELQSLMRISYAVFCLKKKKKKQTKTTTV